MVKTIPLQVFSLEARSSRSSEMIPCETFVSFVVIANFRMTRRNDKGQRDCYVCPLFYRIEVALFNSQKLLGVAFQHQHLVRFRDIQLFDFLGRVPIAEIVGVVGADHDVVDAATTDDPKSHCL